jgi:MoaA/NifB/PqqE/SkfB family radical SAM enzyme
MDFFARHDDMLFMVYTNGTCITEKVAKRMNEIGNVAPMISVEGFKEDTDKRRGRGVYDRTSKTMEWLKNYGVLFGFSAMVTKKNSEILGSAEFFNHYIEKGCKFGWLFQYIPIGRCPDVSVMATPAQRMKLRKDVERISETKPIFIGDFWNDGHYIGGCLAGGKHYLYITNNGNVEPCVFANFYVDNIKDKSLKEILQSGFFTAIREAQAFSVNKNLLAPCMIIDHPRTLRDLVKKFEAKGSHDEDIQLIKDEKIVRHLDEYSKNVNQLTGPEWEGEYSKWNDYWLSHFDSVTNNAVEA